MGGDDRQRDRWGIHGDGDLAAEPDAQTRFELAKAYADMGLLRDAMSELELVLGIEPDHVGARAELENVRRRLPKP
jgi:hypothetical protein